MSVSTIRDGLRAALPAALVSGLPSTAHALVTGGDPMEASIAAGSLLLPQEQRRVPLLAAAIPVHITLSVGWALILAATLPRRNAVVEGVLAGLVIAATDLGVIGKRYPRIKALRPVPQIADHVAFGIVVSLALPRGEADR